MPKAITPNSFTLTSITAIIAVILLGWQFLVSPLAYPFQMGLLAASLFLVGIPHGALDHLVQQETLKRRGTKFKLLFFVLKYVLVMALYAFAWYVLPQISLALFIIMSCWHFGETDVDATELSIAYASFIRLFYGLSVLAWLLFAHTAEVSNILAKLIPANSSLFRFWVEGMVYSNLILLISGLMIMFSIIITPSIKQNKKNWWLKAELLFILFSCYFLPLLPAFALYFSGWHSVITLYNINEYLEGGFTFQINSLKKIWLKAVPFSLLAISGLVFTGYMLRYYAPLFNPLPLLFVFLSLITLPHLGVMHLLNRKDRN